jgi:type VI secretion system secreted protein Hcp
MISAYLKLEGEKAGKIKGPVRDRDDIKDGSIALLGVEHGITSARDPATGMAIGRRQHLPITVTKEVDHTSPFFYQFIAHNELIKNVEICFFGSSSQPGLSMGRESMQYKITLRKAWVSKVEFAGQPDAAAPENNRFKLTERISLVYDLIYWEWASPKIAAEDNFSSAQT